MTPSTAVSRDSQARLHPIDYLDVALSAKSVARVERAARAMLHRHMPAADGNLTPQQTLALFLDHVFWDESNGRLYLCADLEHFGYWLHIPRGDWSLKPHLGPVQ